MFNRKINIYIYILKHLIKPGPVDNYIGSFICENQNASSIYITNTRLSFYSGHSSLGSFAGTYILCFIHESFYSNFGQFSLLRKILAIILDFVIFILYLYPGYTQWMIYWHFLTDVLSGFSAGILLALLIFNTVNNNNTHIKRHSLKSNTLIN